MNLTRNVLVLLAIVSFASATSIAQDACQYIVNGTASYNLIDFANIPIKTLTHKHGVSEYDFTFHLCNRAVYSCGIEKEKQNQNTLVNAILEHDQNHDTCMNITGPEDHPVPSFLDQTNSSKGMILTFPVHESKNQKSTFRVLLECNPKVAAKDIEWRMDIQSNIDISGQSIVIYGEGAPGCPSVTLDGIIKFFEDNKHFFAVIFFFIGLFALLAGLRFFNVTIFILSSFAVSLALTVVIFLITNIGETEGGRWVVFVICVFIGLTSGYVAVKIEKIGFFVLGAVLGGVGALFLHTALIHFLNISSTVLIVLIVLCSIIGGWLTVLLWKDIIILSTSLIGSYLVVRGASFFIGGFPAEMEIASGVATFDYRAYVYLGVMVVVAIIGMVYQFKNKKAMEEIESDYYQEPSIAKF